MSTRHGPPRAPDVLTGPPYDYPPYRSTKWRAPKRALWPMPASATERGARGSGTSRWGRRTATSRLVAGASP